MCNHENRERAMEVVERDADGTPTVWCDPCIYRLVKALNRGGLRTIASCCGHGEKAGAIALADGRELLILPDYETARMAERAIGPLTANTKLTRAVKRRRVERVVRAGHNGGRMDYLKLLEHSYSMSERDQCPPESRLEYLGDHIFNFTTYDGEMSALFAGKAIEVCDAINNRTTFDYISDSENYKWFLLMCNMPFFAGRLNWGTSIRGAWWDTNKLESCGLYEGEEQVLALHFTREGWAEFAKALVVFARSDVRPNPGGKPPRETRSA